MEQNRIGYFTTYMHAESKPLQIRRGLYYQIILDDLIPLKSAINVPFELYQGDILDLFYEPHDDDNHNQDDDDVPDDPKPPGITLDFDSNLSLRELNLVPA